MLTNEKCPKGARLLKPEEVPVKGDYVRWSESKRDQWVNVSGMTMNLPVATLRARCGQSEMQFCTFSK